LAWEIFNLKTKDMKRLILFLFYGLLGTQLFAQPKLSNSTDVVRYLSGTWEWICTLGGFTGREYMDPQTRGYTLKYCFSQLNGNSDSIYYVFYKNDSARIDGKAKIYYSKSTFGEHWHLSYLDGELLGSSIMVDPFTVDTLWLGENAFDGFGHKYAKVSLSSSPENKLIADEVVFYPNPVTGIIHFSQAKAIETVNIRNLAGQTVYRGGAPTDNQLDVGHLPHGIYLVEVGFAGNIKTTEKLVVQ
jgi:hypothetical protein